MEAFFCIPEPFDSTEIQLSLGEVLTVALHSLGPHRKVQWVCELSEASLAPSGTGVSHHLGRRTVTAVEWPVGTC